MAEKKSKFDEMTEGLQGSSHDGANRREGEFDELDEQGFVPRTVFTTDAQPDVARLQIAQLRLAQGLTAEVADKKAQIGQFVLTNFPAKDSVTLVPLAAQNVRTFKPDPKAPPHCQAPTGVWGIGDPGGDCSTCPLSKWGKRDPKTGKSSSAPRCKEGVTLRAYSIDHRCVVDFQFLGRAVGKGAFIQQQAMAFGYGAFAVRLLGEQVKNDKGTWYEPSLELLDEVPEAHADAVGKWMNLVYQAIDMSGGQALEALKAGHMDVTGGEE